MKSSAVFVSLFSLAFLGFCRPDLAFAQHTANGAPSVGTAVPAGSSTSGSASSSGGGSTSGSSGGSSGGSFNGGAGFSSAISRGSHAAGPAVSGNGVFTNYSSLSPVPPFSRPSNGLPVVGSAVPRSSVPPSGGGQTFIPGTYVPGTYIPGTYNPWNYAYDGFVGTSFFGVYDPFFMPSFGSGFAGPGSTTSTVSGPERGALRLHVKPRRAQVYVDDGLVGYADDFQGVFHKLRLEAGIHRVEIRAPGYETLTVKVRIEPGTTMTYQGTLKKAPR